MIFDFFLHGITSSGIRPILLVNVYLYCIATSDKLKHTHVTFFQVITSWEIMPPSCQDYTAICSLTDFNVPWLPAGIMKDCLLLHLQFILPHKITWNRLKSKIIVYELLVIATTERSFERRNLCLYAHRHSEKRWECGRNAIANFINSYVKQTCKCNQVLKCYQLNMYIRFSNQSNKMESIEIVNSKSFKTIMIIIKKKKKKI